jgi:hypothetical protein
MARNSRRLHDPRLTDEEFIKRLAEVESSTPPHVVAAMRRYPPTQCYRSTQNPRFHYVIERYQSSTDHDRVGAVLMHGADSTLPGVGTFGQPLEQLIPCNCGKWEPPTEAQKLATHKRMQRMAQERMTREQHKPKDN